jgi:hypothetical protein
MKIKTILVLMVVIIILTSIITQDTFALFSDEEPADSNNIAAWVSQTWIQTSQQDYEAGVLNVVNTSVSPGDVILSLVPNPTIITSDNSEVYTDNSSSSGWQWVKTLNFTKSGADYNALRIDSSLKSDSSSSTAELSIYVDDVEQFTQSTNSTTYEDFSNNRDFSGYADGPHTIKLYLRTNGGIAYNSRLELYRTSPVMITSDNSAVTATGDTNWQLKKTLTFTKSGSDYNTLRIDCNLKSTSPATASASIRVDDVELFTHSTSSTSYESFSDILDFSGYADGEHTVKLYLKIGNKNKEAYNSVFELYRTNPVLITSDNSEVSVTATLEYQMLKSLTVNKNGASYNEIRIDSNLKSSGPATAYSSIRVDEVEIFNHSTSETSYQSYSDVFDLSPFADGPHTIKLYLKSSNKNAPAYNSQFEIYRTWTYNDVGSIASQVFDTSTLNGRWDALSWDETLPASTDIAFSVRASDSPFLKEDVSPSWIPVSGEGMIETDLPPGRFKQWRATLTTTDADLAMTPTLHEVTVYYLYRPE